MTDWSNYDSNRSLDFWQADVRKAQRDAESAMDVREESRVELKKRALATLGCARTRRWTACSTSNLADFLFFTTVTSHFQACSSYLLLLASPWSCHDYSSTTEDGRPQYSSANGAFSLLSAMGQHEHHWRCRQLRLGQDVACSGYHQANESALGCHPVNGSFVWPLSVASLYQLPSRTRSIDPSLRIRLPLHTGTSTISTRLMLSTLMSWLKS
jgi:hypothetical protein